MKMRKTTALDLKQQLAQVPDDAIVVLTAFDQRTALHVESRGGIDVVQDGDVVFIVSLSSVDCRLRGATAISRR